MSDFKKGKIMDNEKKRVKKSIKKWGDFSDKTPTHFRTWKSGKSWFYGASLLTTLLFSGVTSTQAVFADGATDAQTTQEAPSNQSSAPATTIPASTTSSDKASNTEILPSSSSSSEVTSSTTPDATTRATPVSSASTSVKPLAAAVTPVATDATTPITTVLNYSTPSTALTINVGDSFDIATFIQTITDLTGTYPAGQQVGTVAGVSRGANASYPVTAANAAKGFYLFQYAMSGIGNVGNASYGIYLEGDTYINSLFATNKVVSSPVTPFTATSSPSAAGMHAIKVKGKDGNGSSAADLGTVYVNIVAPTTSATVNFNPNGGGGTASSLSTDANGDLTLPSYGTGTNGLGFTAPANEHFVGWNTAADGSGTGTLDQATLQNLAAGSTVTLYAQWANNPVISYDSNGGTGTMTSQITVGTGPTWIVTTNDNTYTKTGYVFTGWNTAADGSGTSYLPQVGSSNTGVVISGITTDLKLYAQWVPFKVGAYDTTNNVDITSKATGLPVYGGNTGSLPGILVHTSDAPTIAGYTFTGNVNYNGTVSAINSDGNNGFYFVLGSLPQSTPTPSLQFLYTANATQSTYSVTFNNNGGTGTMSSVTTDTTGAVSLPKNSFTRSGYSFSGWATSTTGSIVYADGASVTGLSSNTTLYAVWTAKSPTVTAGSPQTLTSTREINILSNSSLPKMGSQDQVQVSEIGIALVGLTTFTFLYSGFKRKDRKKR
ncbi:hypothetical protein GHI93_04490 [Lactococcus hircilactis]|uniref:InlB B-repeat-containing protein n=2 Tax=Lactococcus hircilactis TaxID=1494462 RepID=A0A7X1Z7L2_9LACT|nr:hypothetical protein [Lactococcus hircilactis]